MGSAFVTTASMMRQAVGHGWRVMMRDEGGGRWDEGVMKMVEH